jgi:hypothetical protein
VEQITCIGLAIGKALRERHQYELETNQPTSFLLDTESNSVRIHWNEQICKLPTIGEPLTKPVELPRGTLEMLKGGLARSAARLWYPAALQDRFKYQIDLSPADIREVATKRVLSKRTEKEGMLRQIVWKLTQKSVWKLTQKT